MTKQNLRLTIANVVLMGALVAGLAATSWNRVGAHEDPAPEGNTAESHECDFAGDDSYLADDDSYSASDDSYFGGIASYIGISENALLDGFYAGKSIVDLAVENGVDPQTVIDSMVAEQNAWIDEVAAAGEITADEAAEWKAETVEFVTAEVNNDFSAFAGFEGFDDASDKTAELLGITVEELWEQKGAGRSVADIAKEKGVDVQTIIDALIAEEQAFIDEAVAAGETTAEKAAEWSAELASVIAYDVNNVFIDPFTVAAQTIGISEDALWEGLEAGKTVADLATENSVDTQTVIDAVAASEHSQIDAQIEAGLVAAEDVAEWKEEIDAYAYDAVNQTFDEMFEEFDDEAYSDE